LSEFLPKAMKICRNSASTLPGSVCTLQVKWIVLTHTVQH